MAALRKEVRRHVSKQLHVPTQPHNTLVPPVDVSYGNETRQLRGASRAFDKPWRKDKRWWIRRPAGAWHFIIGQHLPRNRRSEVRLASYWWSRRTKAAWQTTHIWINGSWARHIWNILAKSYFNVLLIFIPLAVTAGLVPWSPDTIFALNFLAIVPLVNLIYSASEDLTASLNPMVGDLLVAVSDNLVELVVGIVALSEGEIRLVQSSMLGSVLCYSLLVMGSCLVLAGLKYHESHFNETSTQSIASLVLVAVLFINIPATLSATAKITSEISMQLSHAMAIILLMFYIMYLFFRLKTHTSLFDEEDEEELTPPQPTDSDSTNISGPMLASTLYVGCIVCLTICARYLIRSLAGISSNVSKTFIGLILFPFLGNTSDYVSACRVCLTDRMDLTIMVTFGSSMQILLFTLPCSVLLGWIIGQPLTLQFDLFQTVVLSIGVLIITFVVAEGRSTYLKGAMCIALYAIIALAAYVSPDIM